MFILLIVKIYSVQLGVHPFSKCLLYLLIRILSPFLYFIRVCDFFSYNVKIDFPSVYVFSSLFWCHFNCAVYFFIIIFNNLI